MRGPATATMRRSGTLLARQRQRLDHALQQRRADARAADRDDAERLLAVAQLGAQRGAVGRDGPRVEARDVARELVVALASTRGSPAGRGRTLVRDDVVGVADEDRAVADAAGSARCARSSRRCSRRSGTPRARRLRASAGSRRSRSARRTAPSSARGSRAGSGRPPRPRRRSRGRNRSSRTTSWKSMKFAQRISSIRRIAWNACRSCSPASRSMCAALAGELARWPGGSLSPRASQHGRHRLLGEPVDLEPGHLPAQLVRDRDVAPGVAEADRRRDEQRALGAVVRRASSVAPRRAAAGDALGELAQQQVDLHRVARLRRVARALEPDELAAGQLGRPARRARTATMWSSVPWMTTTGQRDRAAERLDRLVRSARPDVAPRVAISVSAVVSQAPGDAVLDLLGRVRLGEHLAEEELEEARDSRAARSAG